MRDGTQVQATVSEARVWVRAEMLVSCNPLTREVWGWVLRRGPLFPLQTAQSQSWFHITNPEPPAPAPPRPSAPLSHCPETKI